MPFFQKGLVKDVVFHFDDLARFPVNQHRVGPITCTQT